MHKELYIISLAICVLTHLIRTIYEILKHRKILKPNKLSFIVVFANMIILWMSWFALCSFDLYRIEVNSLIRYLGLALVVLGILSFLTALVTIKSLESHEGDLITHGIYSRIRHPMYLGFILWLIGMPVFCGALFSFALGIVLIANVLFWRTLEELELENRFTAYRDYKKRTMF